MFQRPDGTAGDGGEPPWADRSGAPWRVAEERTQGSPPGRQPRAPGSVRTLISTWLLTEPELTPAQIRQRLLDEHDAGTSYSTIGHYRRSIINSHYRLNAHSRPDLMTATSRKAQ